MTRAEFMGRLRRGLVGMPAAAAADIAADYEIHFEDGLAAGIDDAWKSTLLCLLGNIAARTGRSRRCDPATGRVCDDAEAEALWSREYEPGWEVRA